MRDSLGFMWMGGPDLMSCYLEIRLWCVGMSNLPHEHFITPSRAEWGVLCAWLWREWAAGCTHLLMAGPSAWSLPLAPSPQLWGRSYLLTLSCDMKNHRTRLIRNGCKHSDLPPSWGVCVPFLIPGLGKVDSGLPPGLLDKLLEAL